MFSLRVYFICILPLFFFFRFSVNRRIFVVGFGLYGSIHGPTDYQVNIQVRVITFTRVSLLVSGQILYLFCRQVGMGLGLIWFVLWLQIIHTDSNTVLGQNDTGFSCDGSANTFRVMFKEPVEILPNVNYTACATLKVCVASLPHLRFGFCSLFNALCLLHRVQIPIMVLKECER